jgi:hypothetical protein
VRIDATLGELARGEAALRLRLAASAMAASAMAPSAMAPSDSTIDRARAPRFGEAESDRRRAWLVMLGSLAAWLDGCLAHGLQMSAIVKSARARVGALRFGVGVALLTLVLTSCAASSGQGRPEAATVAEVATSADAATVAEAATWRYRVRAGPEARELRVEVELPPGVPESLGVDAFADPFLDELEVDTERGWQPLRRSGRRWSTPLCRERGCSLRYRYHLGAAAEQIDRFAYAGFRAGVLMAPPSTFLLAPQNYGGGDRYRLEVVTAPGESFVSGVWRDGDGGSAYSAPASVLFQAPYSAFGRFERESIALDGGRIELAFAPGEGALGVSHAVLRRGLERAAQAVSRYYGRFPVPSATVIVLPSPGGDINGMQLGRDWVMTHELLHLGFPTLEREYLWLAEGLATYQEPLVRARAGMLGEQDLWRGYLAGFPQGLPNASDRGLDGSTRWGRVYWGGALVFLLLDVELRSRSRGRLSLDAAARAIQRAGGDTAVRWSLRETLGAGDAVLDAPSLASAYARFADAPVQVGLAPLFERLGVRAEGDRVVFDDGAELAAVRRALSAH